VKRDDITFEKLDPSFGEVKALLKKRLDGALSYKPIESHECTLAELGLDADTPTSGARFYKPTFKDTEAILT